MDELVLFKKYEALKNLNGIVSNLVRGKPNKSSCFEMLKQISVQKFKNETLMLSKSTFIKHSNDIMIVLRIFLHNVF